MKGKLNFEDFKEMYGDELPIKEENESYRNHSKGIALTISYLLGITDEAVLKRIEDPNEYTEIKSKLEKDEDCLAIRHLNNIRSNLMLHFAEVSRALRNISLDYKPLDKMEEFEEDFRYLKRIDISVISGNRDINEYIRNINREILKRIDKIQKHFPTWVKFKNIRSLFIMPSNIEEEAKKFVHYRSAYPYQRYIYWKNPDCMGYILYADKFILEIAYSNNNECFQEYSKVMDISNSAKRNIDVFFEQAQKIQIFIDGDNADPYMTASAISGLSDYEFDKIDKILVYYDAVHSSRAWEFLKHFVDGIEVEAIPVERIALEKSLVDHKLVMGVSKAVYKDAADSIILVSSDSDFWSVIDGMKETKFMVMAQQEKCGHSFKSLLRENNVFYCYIERFNSAKNNSFFKGVFRNGLKDLITSEFKFMNAKTLFALALRQTRAEISAAEKEMLFDKYIKGLTLTVDSNGNFEIVIPE